LFFKEPQIENAWSDSKSIEMWRDDDTSEADPSIDVEMEGDDMLIDFSDDDIFEINSDDSDPDYSPQFDDRPDAHFSSLEC